MNQILSLHSKNTEVMSTNNDNKICARIEFALDSNWFCPKASHVTIRQPIKLFTRT